MKVHWNISVNRLEDYHKSAWTTVVVHRPVQCENVVTIPTWSKETIPKNHLISTSIIIKVMICFDFYLLLSHASFFPSLQLLDQSSPSAKKKYVRATLTLYPFFVRVHLRPFRFISFVLPQTLADPFVDTFTCLIHNPTVLTKPDYHSRVFVCVGVCLRFVRWWRGVAWRGVAWRGVVVSFTCVYVLCFSDFCSFPTRSVPLSSPFCRFFF